MIVTELLWNDPSEDVSDWEENERGCGQIFGKNNLNAFVKALDLDLICRGHQVMENGYGFFGDEKKLVTVFSAKNYCGEFDNDAAVMTVDKSLKCSFEVFKGESLVKQGENKLKKPTKRVTNNY